MAAGALAVVLGATVAGCGTPTATVATISYCPPGGPARELDLYTPSPAPTGPVPAVVYVHGGGWVAGSQTLSPFIALIEHRVIAAGDVFVSVNYRLAPGNRWPAQIEDVTCAVRFLRHQAKDLDIDPARIAALGDSAGGQLVSLLGLAGPGAGFDAGPYPGVSSAVDAVADLYGPADLTAPDWAGDTAMGVFADATFGQPFGRATAELAAASPVTYVSRRAPPFLIVQGADDTIVPAGQSRELARRLTAAGAHATLVLVAHAGHGLIPEGGHAISPDTAQLSGRIAAFLLGAAPVSSPRR
ncbi:MAG: alpha/beta hydrolase fold domain-containing protein [Acidimicrobiales bacterium]